MPKQEFDAKITIALTRDEAIVLRWFLSREIWNKGAERLRSAIEHPSEEHAFNGLLQAFAPPLFDTGDPKYADEIHTAAQAHHMARFE